MKSKRLVFMNSGMHFWNREKEIFAELNSEYEILLIINYEGNKNYSLEDIINYCASNKISLFIINNIATRARNPLNIFRAVTTIKKIIKFKPDLIYLENFCDPYFTLFCIFLNKSKVIISIMDYELHPYEGNKTRFSDRFYRFIYLTFFKNFQLFSSEQVRLIQKEHPRKNIFHIPLFLIKNDFKVANTSNKTQNELFTFLFYGKIYFYKGLDILIEAGNILASRYSNFKIIIAGYCDDFTEFEKQIENKDFYELKIRYLSKEETHEVMMKSDILVLPYRQVTQSGPLMMAFNFGIIPLASDLKGFQELIENRHNGFLFNNNSVDGLVKIMEEIILMSASNRETIHKNLKKFVSDNYDLQVFVNKYKLMFNSIVDNK